MIVADARHLPSLLRTLSPSLVVGMPMRNMVRTVARAAASVLDQRGVRKRMLLVVLDDDSSDGSAESLRQFASEERIVVVRGRWGSAWAVRNAFLDGAASARGCELTLRLDADDVMEDSSVVASIERRFRCTPSFRGRGRRAEPMALLGGNALVSDGRRLPRVNVPDGRLVEVCGLRDRLSAMAAGDPTAELPSCNLVLRAGAPWRYPKVTSAEDHWLTAAVLMEARGQVELMEDRLYCAYSLSGELTRRNRARDRHRASREQLFEAARCSSLSRRCRT